MYTHFKKGKKTVYCKMALSFEERKTITILIEVFFSFLKMCVHFWHPL
jgi:hypothetical protein